MLPNLSIKQFRPRIPTCGHPINGEFKMRSLLLETPHKALLSAEYCVPNACYEFLGRVVISALCICHVLHHFGKVVEPIRWPCGSRLLFLTRTTTLGLPHEWWTPS